MLHTECHCQLLPVAQPRAATAASPIDPSSIQLACRVGLTNASLAACRHLNFLSLLRRGGSSLAALIATSHRTVSLPPP